MFIKQYYPKDCVTSIIPEKYELEFEPDLKKFTFKGKEIVYVNCKSFTNKIILNAIELKINRL